MNEGEESRFREIVRVIESDHQSTTDYIARLTTLRTAARGVIVTLGSALISLALVNDSWPTAVAGIPVAVVGLLAEARSDFLLYIAHNRAMSLEYKIQAYVTLLIETGPMANDAEDKFEKELDRYQFGISRSLRGSSLAKMLSITCKTVTFWLYLGIISALALTAVGIAVTEPVDQPTCEPVSIKIPAANGRLLATSLPGLGVYSDALAEAHTSWN